MRTLNILGGSLTPVEKYAMNLLEVFQDSISFEQLKLAEEEIEAHKKEWELGRLEAEKEEILRREEAMEEDRDPMLTCHRDDAYNQVKKRSKIDDIVDKGRQNCVKVIEDKNKINKSKNRNVSTGVKRAEHKMTNQVSNNGGNKSGVRRSPRSPIVTNNRTPKTRNSSHNTNSNSNESNSKTKNNHIRRSNSRSVSKPIENGNQTNSPNANRKNR